MQLVRSFGLRAVDIGDFQVARFKVGKSRRPTSRLMELCRTTDEPWSREASHLPPAVAIVWTSGMWL